MSYIVPIHKRLFNFVIDIMFKKKITQCLEEIRMNNLILYYIKHKACI